VSQQYASLAQTHASTFSSSQPGLACCLQQSPVHEPHWSASAAQIESQVLLQQNGSMAQTHFCTAASLQPGPLCAMQHDAVLGHGPQSCGQVEHVSP
jgi:hypothetical protein